MLLPDKHITLAESILGLGAVVLESLDRPRTIDYLFKTVRQLRDAGRMPAFHDFDTVTLAVLFLYSVGVVESTESGTIRRCGS
jgi:hypothetical protein